jgi:hypothetical protein
LNNKINYFKNFFQLNSINLFDIYYYLSEYL